jgi:hypothetical protein
MLITALITVATYVLTLFIAIVSPIFAGAPDVTGYLSSGIGYVFGNLRLFNEFLPITEAFVLVGIALSFKLTIFAYKVILFFMHTANFVRKTFIGI